MLSLSTDVDLTDHVWQYVHKSIILHLFYACW